MIRLAVRCPEELAEAVLAELLALAPGGVEESSGRGYVEYAIYGAPGELPDLGSLSAGAGGARVEVTSREVPGDWQTRWRRFHRPVRIGGALRVRPPWVGPEEGPDPEVVIDPGQAFGTGAHHTTRLCLEAMIGLSQAGRAHGALADWGTGSGVLAIAAAKLGWSPVRACDHEPAALEGAAANAHANGVELELCRSDLRRQAPPEAPTALANLTRELLLACARRLQAPPGLLVCSGLLAAEADEVAAAFAPHGLRELARRGRGGWALLVLES